MAKLSHSENKEIDDNSRKNQERYNRKPDNSPTISDKPVNQKNSLSNHYIKLRKSVVTIFTYDYENVYQGSGFFISASGVCVSNYHVFDNTDVSLAEIKTSSGDYLNVQEILEADSVTDYIIFKIKRNAFEKYPAVTISQKVPLVGDNVFAIGSPQGLEYTLSTGIISAIRSANSEEDFIQTTAEITHGSSGGPLFNTDGEVIGITTAGLGEADLNFAVNIQKLNLKRYID